MAKSENKTKPTDVPPAEFIASVDHPRRREDGLALLDFFNEVTGLEPRMWGGSIIGYGRYYYKYDSGREGEFLLTGFSPRKSALSLYVMSGFSKRAEKMERLGKHKTGRGCLYVNKLSDIDMDVLKEIILDDLAFMRAKYQTWDV